MDTIRVAFIPNYIVDQYGKATLLLCDVDTGEIKEIKYLDDLVSLLTTQNQRDTMLRQVAMEYNWRHPSRKVSWRHMNRPLRKEAFFRLMDEYRKARNGHCPG